MQHQETLTWHLREKVVDNSTSYDDSSCMHYVQPSDAIARLLIHALVGDEELRKDSSQLPQMLDLVTTRLQTWPLQCILFILQKVSSVPTKGFCLSTIGRRIV